MPNLRRIVIGGGGHDGQNLQGNTASGPASVIGGGVNNFALSTYTTVAGGAFNNAEGFYSTIGGGFGHHVGDASTVSGGRLWVTNTLRNSSSFTIGSGATIIKNTSGSHRKQSPLFSVEASSNGALRRWTRQPRQ